LAGKTTEFFYKNIAEPVIAGIETEIEFTYFDIREIVMPPQKSLKVIVPIGIAYNVYFRNEYKAPDDEKLEINTSNTRKVKLNGHKLSEN
jgi:hypothetical protein